MLALTLSIVGAGIFEVSIRFASSNAAFSKSLNSNACKVCTGNTQQCWGDDIPATYSVIVDPFYTIHLPAPRLCSDAFAVSVPTHFLSFSSPPSSRYRKCVREIYTFVWLDSDTTSLCSNCRTARTYSAWWILTRPVPKHRPSLAHTVYLGVFLATCTTMNRNMCHSKFVSNSCRVCTCVLVKCRLLV